jgi:hypothetical protein
MAHAENDGTNRKLVIDGKVKSILFWLTVCLSRAAFDWYAVEN